MSSKKQVFDSLFTGIEDITDSKGKVTHTVLYSKNGNPSSVFEIENPVQQWCTDADQYYAYMDIWDNVLQTLGEGYCLQKQDIFCRQAYHHDITPDMEFLSQSYFRYYEGRPYTEIRTFIIFYHNHIKVKIVMKSKQEIIRFKQLRKDSTTQEVLEYLNKEFNLIVMDPKERHYFDLEDCVDFFFKTRDEGINFVTVNMNVNEDYKIVHRDGQDHYLLSILGMGMVIKFNAAPAIKLFHQAFLTNFENLIEKYNNLRKRHRDLIKKDKKQTRENAILAQRVFDQAKTIKKQEERIKELEAQLRSASRNSHIIGVRRIRRMFIRLKN